MVLQHVECFLEILEILDFRETYKNLSFICLGWKIIFRKSEIAIVKNTLFTSIGAFSLHFAVNIYFW